MFLAAILMLTAMALALTSVGLQAVEATRSRPPTEEEILDHGVGQMCTVIRSSDDDPARAAQLLISYQQLMVDVQNSDSVIGADDVGRQMRSGIEQHCEKPAPPPTLDS